ncbi:hypothetical protein CC85DRAFT_288279 [Cutaneotrichosporon oleaginosum]|uniref:Extracellular membrane protein CFEM domain-containing protein n=1 Tax=Cutaneotrichosporon oleaginosum TaxID=879819 RepID=A0A0J0XF86_9TREE|nr:uncharacterized protein CC85DRAFT_288279 [Cutaneotrichosporon oleaginosum]KLT39708.1 hypothetical protein CC85DRAFT_288279 [Cutaneotrichosporon oleaginosum]TXT12424.1 hypothetical protein COLE_02834 [Cutaneotrichosporon oleaginosum]
MRFPVLVSVAALAASVSASPAKRQDACATQCDFEQKFCAFRESPDCATVCTAAEYNKWVACHACQLQAGNTAEADALKTAIARLAAGCLSTGNGLTGGSTSALASATGAAPASAASSAPAGAVVDAASPSGSASPMASVASSASAAMSSAMSSAASAVASGSAAAPSASAPAASTTSSGAMGNAVPVLAGVVGVAAALLA